MTSDRLTDDQAKARAWLDARQDQIECPSGRGHGRTTLRACAKHIKRITYFPGGTGPLTERQRRLRERWAGCQNCEHAPAARALLKKTEDTNV